MTYRSFRDYERALSDYNQHGRASSGQPPPPKPDINILARHVVDHIERPSPDDKRTPSLNKRFAEIIANQDALDAATRRYVIAVLRDRAQHALKHAERITQKILSSAQEDASYWNALADPTRTRASSGALRLSGFFERDASALDDNLVRQPIEPAG
jgi:hypothetical protein